MSQSESEPSHRPVSGAKIQPLAYGLSVHFHPPIKLDRKKGLEFAPKLSSAIDPRGVELEEGKWVFSQPLGTNPASTFGLTVTDSGLAIEAAFPTDPQDLFENRYGVILSEFQKFFRPELLLGFSSLIRATLQIDGDARTFLARHVTKFDTARLKPLARPIHLFGIRLFLPPFQRSKEVPTKGRKRKKPTKKIVETTDWAVDIKAESLLEDLTKLFLEGQAIWQTPQRWNAAGMKKVIEGVATISQYLEGNFIPFLTSDPKHGDA